MIEAPKSEKESNKENNKENNIENNKENNIENNKENNIENNNEIKTGKDNITEKKEKNTHSEKENQTNNIIQEKPEITKKITIINENEKEEEITRGNRNTINEYVFKVVKLGRRGFSHKERILQLNKKGISYYIMPNYNRFTKEFLDNIQKIYSSRNFEDKTFGKFRLLAELFNKIPENEKN